MFYLPAIHCESNEPVWLRKEEILYLIRSKRKIEIYTFSGVLRFPGSIADLSSLLFRYNFAFGETNSSIVNLHNVTIYDKISDQAQFIHKSGRVYSVAVSRRNRSKFVYL